MVFVKNVNYCVAESGEHIGHFATELVEYRSKVDCDIIAKFNNAYIEVTENTCVEDIIFSCRLHVEIIKG